MIRYFFGFICLLFTTNLSSQILNGNQKDLDKIIANTKMFSDFYMVGDAERMAQCYTLDAKIFPENSDIIAGREAIQKRWTTPSGVRILRHVITPREISVIKNTAYDYGYYEGETEKANGDIVAWKGKYVVIWKKIKNDWKIYLDIWNRID
jgi:ketosteroid isomerase-like protein